MAGSKAAAAHFICG